MRKYAWILLGLLLFACWVSGCGGGGGSSSTIEPSPDDYLIEALVDGQVVRWTRPISVYMNQTDVPPTWKPAHAVMLQDGAAEWANAAPGRLSFNYITSRVDPCITIKWVTDHPLGEDPPTIGVSKLHLVTIGGTQYIQRVEIALATTSGGTPMPDAIMRLLSIHELGHAIGIWGHSDVEGDIMFPELGGQTGLSARDVTTINRLYSLAPSVSELTRSVRGLTPEETTTITMP